MRILLPIIILLLGGGGFVALKASKPEPERLERAEKTWIVAVEEVATTSISPTLTLYGVIESPRVARLTAAVAADVSAVHVLDGQQVADQQLLLSLDDRETNLVLL